MDIITNNVPLSFSTRKYIIGTKSTSCRDLGHKKEKKWYISFFLDSNNEGTYRLDRLERLGTNDNKWVRPNKDDIQDAEEIQILPVNIEWDFTSEKPIFIVDNVMNIKDTFKNICDIFDK